MSNEKKVFTDFDFTDFWYSGNPELDEDFEIEPPSDETIASVEASLGYKFPESYIEFMKIRNGGVLEKCYYPHDLPTPWIENYWEISDFFSIGSTATYSLCGELGGQFMMESWNYPDIGVYICNCPSAGHDMILLDYSECGRNMENGEPKVVHVDQESDYGITLIADNFETFVKGLVSDSNFE